MNDLYTIEQVAEHFGLSPKQVIAKCSTATNPWPHMRPISRKSATWRFTAEDVETIEQRIRTREVSVDSWGRTGRRSA